MTNCLMKNKLIFNCLFLFVLHLFSINLKAQQRNEVKGQIKDENGQQIALASVVAKNISTNFSAGAQSDSNGVFKFVNLPLGGPYTFTVNCIGYETQTLSSFSIKEGANITLLVKLKTQVKTLDQVVVVGYGSQKKGNITSSIASVKMDNIDQGSTGNAVKLLQGRASGVNIITPSGSPGTQPVILVRGIGSISGGSQPLYVVDGVPNETFPNLNPNDIESMDVLKDAAAASIYGSRANSGVIIITTKSGKTGKTQISFSSKYGVGSIYHDIKMANSTEYATVMQAATDNYNKQKGTSVVFYKPTTIEETDWVKEISRSSAVTSSVNLNMSGGTEKTKFFTSFGYFNQEGILKTTFYKQYNLRAKFTQEVTKFINLNLNISGNVAPQRMVEENSTSLKNLRNSREEQPWYSPYLFDGTYKINGTYILRHNPVMMYNEESWTRNTYEGIGNLSIDITPIKGFKFTPSISVYSNFIDEKKKLTDQMAARRFTAGWGALLRDRNTSLRFIVDNILSYNGSFKGLNYNAMIGHSYEKLSTDLLGIYSSNYANNAYPSPNLDIINAGSAVFPDPLSNDFQSYNLESYLGRLNLDFKGRYIFNASIRRDGSSRFSKERRYGTFPSASLGWRVSRENFWNTNNVISDLKLRVSYGSTGSMAGIGNYAASSLVAAGFAYNNQGSLVLQQDAQNVTWEKANQFDAGFDLDLLKGRVNLTVDYYYQKTTDLLFNKPIYASSGYTSIPSNIGSLGNQGLEFSFGAKVLNGAFKWNVNANISFIKNKLLSLYDNSNMYIVPASGLNQIGGQMHALINSMPISSFYMLKMQGIYQIDSDVPTKLFTKGVRAGDVIYEDVNGDGDINDADRQYVGKAIPDFYGGITNNFSWKGFELNIFSQFSKGNQLMASWRGVNSEGTEHLGDAVSNVGVGGGVTASQYFNVSQAAATSYWNGPGTSNTMPRPVRNGVFSGYTFNYNLLPSTRQLEDASYFKIKTVTLAYELPKKLIQNASLNNAHIFLTVDNVLTFTKYSGYDPEQSFANNPGDSNYGVDFGLQAALRTYMFGINIQF